MLFALFALLSALAHALPEPLAVISSSSHPTIPRKIGKRCTGHVSSLSDVSAAQDCTIITIGAFTVPAGETFLMNVPDGAHISLTGQVAFGVAYWAGPLFRLVGNNVTFNGNGFQFVGNGDQYWDGLGQSGGVTKPAPMMILNHGGTFENLVVLNSPSRAISVRGNGDTLTVTGVTVDNSAGDAANSRSNGKVAGVNTDGFDVSGDNINIQDSIVKNQDDCLAINKGTGITFTGNQCSGGHGISIGSISSSATVSTVSISGNIVTDRSDASGSSYFYSDATSIGSENSVQALRIKTDKTATGSTVSGVTYSDNHASGITRYGVLIDQSYPSTLGTPGTGVKIADVTFSGNNVLSVGSSAHRVEVNCGSTHSCAGTWNFAGLTVTGGSAGAVKNAPVSGGSF